MRNLRNARHLVQEAPTTYRRSNGTSSASSRNWVPPWLPACVPCSPPPSPPAPSRVPVASRCLPAPAPRHRHHHPRPPHPLAPLLVHLSPNRVRATTEDLGVVLVAQQAQQAARAEVGDAPPAADTTGPSGSLLRGMVCSPTCMTVAGARSRSAVATRHAPARIARAPSGYIRAHSLSYVTALAQAETFGWHLWQAATRRGVLDAAEVVVGDGAHWIWNLAETQLPGATQIVDWDHASAYVWEAARAIWGKTHPHREAWAHAQVDALWDGKVDDVVAELEQQRAAGEGVTAALSYDTTHRGRMDYAVYRARGLQIGSGSVESACQHLARAPLKQAGMNWEAAGAESLGAWEEQRGQMFASPEWQAMFARMNDLIESGQTEFYNIHLSQ